MTYQNKAFQTFTWGILGTVSSGLIYFVGNIILTEIPNIKAEIQVIKSKSENVKEYLHRIDKRIEKIHDHLIDKK